MLHELYSVKLIVVYIFILSNLYIHYRGKARLTFKRQIQDHSTITAPINCLMYFFSSVPNTPYVSIESIPQLKVLKDNWKTIRKEAEAVLAQGEVKVSDKHDDAAYEPFFRRGWKRFFLTWYRKDSHPSARKLCPKTLELLDNLPCIKAAAFTFLPAGTKLGNHRDPYAGSLRYHLGLITPNSNECAISVDNQIHSWRDGEDVLFDETYVHHAYNNTDVDRLILFCDIERPMKWKIGKGLNWFFGHFLLAAASAPNSQGDRTGGLNKVYKYIYATNQSFRRLKSKNRKLYYWLKYLLIALAVLLILWLI